MNKSQNEVVSGTPSTNRFLWLVGVPTGTCIAVWVALFLGKSDPVLAAIVAALLPVLGLVGVLGYRWLTGDVVRLRAYLPLAVGAAVFAPAIIDLGLATAREPDGAFIPVLPFGVGFLLPVVALACGGVAYQARSAA